MFSGWGGIRTPLENTGKTGVSDQSGAECGALAAREAPLDPELAAVVDAWPALPAGLRAGILAMIDAAKAATKPPNGVAHAARGESATDPPTDLRSEPNIQREA